MKPRSIKILIPVMLALMLFIHFAQAESNMTLLFDANAGTFGPDYSQCVAAMNDTLYIARIDGLYSYHIGDEAPSQLMDFTKADLTGTLPAQSGADAPSIAALLNSGGALFALDIIHGALWRFDEGKAVFVQEAFFDPEEAIGGDVDLCSCFCMQDKAVYYIAADAMTGTRSLYMLDAANGKSVLVRTDVRLIALYEPGTLLAVTDNKRGGASLSLLNLATGQIEEKLALDARYEGLQYDPGTDTAYITRSGEIQASISFKPPKTVARMPILEPEGDGAVLSGRYLALPYRDGVRVISTDPKYLSATPLKILGYTDELPMTDFSIANPDITFESIISYPETTMDLILHMMGGKDAADVYVLYSSDYNLDALYEKGYFADLSGSETVQKTVSAMYPYIKDVLMRDGQIMALPVRHTTMIDIYYPRSLEEAGLTEADVPGTYGELMDFMDVWGEKYAEKYTNMSVFGQGADIRAFENHLVGSIIKAHRYECLRRGDKVTYDTPQMRTLLEKILSTDFSVIQALTPAPSSEPGGNQLFQQTGMVSALADYTASFRYMPLSVSPDAQPVILVNAQLLLINPYSQNSKAAMAFLEYMASSLPGEVRVELMPGENEPVHDPYINELTLKKMEENIALTKKSLEEASEADKRTYQDMLNDLQQQYDYSKQFEWLVTKESIAALRALDSYFMLAQSAPSQDASTTSLSYSRLVDGQMSLDEYLREMDQTERMIEMEK